MSDSEKQPPDQDDSPDLVIDTDWKEQVAKEKEAASKGEPTSDEQASTTESAAGEPGGQQDDSPSQTRGEQTTGESADVQPPPPASFEVLVSMLFTQAMAALGQIPDPETNEPKVNKAYAKHFIDTLDLLQEKTSGNLSEQEKKMLSEALHALRMAFVNVKQ